MSKLIISCCLLLFSNCGSEAPDKAYLPKMEFKKTPNPKYDNYFNNKNDSNANSSPITKNSEPLPSFNENNESKGFFNFLFNDNQNREKDKKQEVCDELLNINKNILIDQNKKLVALNNNNLELINKVNKMQSEIKNINSSKLSKQDLLEKEIDRLNKLIKILSTEIK